MNEEENPWAEDDRWFARRAEVDERTTNAVARAKEAREAAHRQAELDYHAELLRADVDCANELGSEHRMVRWEPTFHAVFGSGQHEYAAVCACGADFRGWGPEQSVMEMARHRNRVDGTEQTEMGRRYAETMRKYLPNRVIA